MTEAQNVEPVWRPAKSVMPGWFVQMEDEWHEVRMTLLSGVRGRQAVRVFTSDGFEAICDASAEVATLTDREARKAGVA